MDDATVALSNWWLFSPLWIFDPMLSLKESFTQSSIQSSCHNPLGDVIFGADGANWIKFTSQVIIMAHLILQCQIKSVFSVLNAKQFNVFHAVQFLIQLVTRFVNPWENIRV